MMKYARFRNNENNHIHFGTFHEDHVKTEEGQSFELNDIKLLTPVSPGKIICVGKNYADHASEMGGDVPEHPLLFFKPPSALNHPGDPIHLPEASRVDYEGEIAVVINGTCKNVAEPEADAVIWGYTCFNDVSNRDAQKWEGNWVRAKGFDTSGCLGPVLVTPDELPDVLEVTTRLNGEIKQQGNTSQLAFSIPHLIAVISTVMTLERGDVIATGTPAGVGPLTSDDVVEIEVFGIGVLKNPVV